MFTQANTAALTALRASLPSKPSGQPVVSATGGQLAFSFPAPDNTGNAGEVTYVASFAQGACNSDANIVPGWPGCGANLTRPLVAFRGIDAAHMSPLQTVWQSNTAGTLRGAVAAKAANRIQSFIRRRSSMKGMAALVLDGGKGDDDKGGSGTGGSGSSSGPPSVTEHGMERLELMVAVRTLLSYGRVQALLVATMFTMQAWAGQPTCWRRHTSRKSEVGVGSRSRK